MAKICAVTGKKPMHGHNVSHANNKTKRRFEVNLHTKRFWVDSQGRYVRLKVSAKGMRIIDKLGIEKVLVRIAERSKNAKRITEE